MEIRYTVPCAFRFELHCNEGTNPLPKPEDYVLHFVFRRHAVLLAPTESKLLARWHAQNLKQDIPIYSVSSLSFEMQDDKLHHLESMCRRAKWEGLAQLLIDTANRSLLAIRTYAGVTSVHPMYGLIPADPIKWATPEAVLADMRTQTSDDNGKSWTPLSCGHASRDARMLEEVISAVPTAGALQAEQWEKLESKIGNGKTFDISRLCLVNAEESAKVGDGRGAVLEAVFALEVVVTRILDYYCRALDVPAKGSNLKGIDLPEKLFFALPLAVGPSWDFFFLEGATKALASISDRNDIAHDGDLRHQKDNAKQERANVKAFWENLHATISFVETLLRLEGFIQETIDMRVKKKREFANRTRVPDDETKAV